MDKDQAQRRADRIRAFGEELEALEKEDILILDEQQKTCLAQHHQTLLSQFSSLYDVDISGADKQLSWSMRIVSFLGALALSAAVFFFFYRFWGLLGTPAQVGILVGAPMVAVVGVDFTARREKTHYFASLFSLIAFTSFVLNLSVLGTIFNITPSQNAFLVWGVFALILAYALGLRLMLVAGMTCVLGYLAATIGTWCGCYWLSFGERPENFLIAGVLLMSAGSLPHHRHGDFPNLYRGYGLLTMFIAILILSNWGQGSYLPWSSGVIEASYQVLGFLLSGGVIALGIRRQWSGLTNLGSTFFVLYLYTKFFDWWWDWMPKYLFFFVLGLCAILILLVLKRLRAAARGGMA
jgi:uncharacterized membrane protein